jgi:hypothetical protein
VEENKVKFFQGGIYVGGSWSNGLGRILYYIAWSGAFFRDGIAVPELY